MSCTNLKLLLSALILFGMGIGLVLGSSCSFTTWENYCALEDISIRTNTEANNFVFPHNKSILLPAPNIPKGGKILFNNVPTIVDKLEIYDGFVPEVKIKNTLYEFRAERSYIRKVIIDETETYLLKFMWISENLLRSLPDNITKLEKLTQLHLPNNEIETINMDQFKALIHLEQLSLQSNKITRIDTKVLLRLPQLASVNLRSNYMEKLSIQLWNFPNLKSIQLCHNKLRGINSFPQHFPTLTETSINYNPWSCLWLEQSAQAIFRTGKIVVTGEIEPCSGKSVSGICCEESLNDVRNFLVQIIDSRFVKLQGAVDQLNEKISHLQPRDEIREF